MNKILVINQREQWPTIATTALKKLEENGREVTFYQIENEEDELENIFRTHQDTEILVTTYFRLNEARLKMLPQLKAIVTSTTATEYMDKKYIQERNIKLISNQSYTGASVAEHAFSLVVALSKRIVELDSLVKSNQFFQTVSPSMELEGKTIGILGMGDVGKKVAKMALAFSMKIQYLSRLKKEDVSYPHVSLETLLKTSDVMVITLPLTEKTRHLLSFQEFSLMRKSAILVSISPDEIIDQKALRKAIEEKNLYVGLDLHSPIDQDLSHYSSQLLLTPTKAWHSNECKERRFLKTVAMVKELIS